MSGCFAFVAVTWLAAIVLVAAGHAVGLALHGQVIEAMVVVAVFGGVIGLMGIGR